ncbi:MAG: phage/plasmid primase, P4 family [Pirellulales bacterium]
MSNGTATQKPSTIPVQPDGIATELRPRPNWVNWCWEWRGKEWTKVPYDPKTGRRAKANDPSTWGTFAQALARYKKHPDKYAGVGFELKDAGLIGFDLDACRDPATGQLTEWAEFLLGLIGPTYGEVSPSGTGLKLLLRGRLPDGWEGHKFQMPGEPIRGKHPEVEVYQDVRYFCLTGERHGDTASIATANGQLDGLHRALCELNPKPAPGEHRDQDEHRDQSPDDDLTDNELIRRASKNPRFASLWNGDTSDYSGDESRADLALCSHLAWWVGGPDKARIDGLFRQSGLMREKWQRQDYRDSTLNKALEGAKFREPQAAAGAKGTGKAGGKDDPGLVKVLADMIVAKECFAKDAGGGLYRFNEGVYKAAGESVVKRHVKHLCEALGQTKKWSIRLATEVCEYIRLDSPELWAKPPANPLNVKNGLLDTRTRDLKPHDPTHLSAVQLPVSYDATATCPRTESFIRDVFPADATDLAWQIAAWSMTADSSIQKAVLLVGSGCNGKSAYLSQLTAFLGKGNVSGVSLHRLEADRFTPVRLLGKLANICPDLPSADLVGSSAFKAITGHDSVVAERKFEGSFEFEPFAKLIFSANSLPKSPDGSDGFFRRWLVLPFDRQFAPEDQVPRQVLDGSLADPRELSGLLNHALDALPYLEMHGFSEPDSVREAAQDFRATTDPLAIWLDRYTITDASAFVPKKTLHTAFNAECERTGKVTMGPKPFGLAIRRHRPELRDGQKMVGGQLQWCYLGIGLTSNLTTESSNSLTQFTAFTG